MATPAATMAVLVQAKGLTELGRQLSSVDGDLRKTAGNAGRAAKDLEDTGKRGKKSLGLLKVAAGALAGVAVFDGLKRGVSAAVDEYEEARKVGALTTSTIKATGGAANITAKQVGELSGAISKKAGIDDEAIQSGANMLLTFKNIRNETGKGRDIFNQTTQAAVDLSAAGFGGITDTSKQLGKALNDPIKGMSALGRSGVTFSEDQKKAITALMDTGKAADRVKAQQIILAEVQSQVGGAAASQATPMDKLRVTLGNLAEAAGSVLVPAFDKGAKILVKFLGGMIDSRGAGGAVIDVFKTTGTVIGTAVKAVSSIVGWLKQHTTIAYALAAAIGVVLAAFVGFKILAAVQAAIVAVRAAMIGLNAAFLMNPIVLVVAAVAALVAAFVIAYRESETFRNIVNAAWNAIKDVAETAWKVIKGVFAGIIAYYSTIFDVGKKVIGALVDGIKAVGGVIAGAAGWVKDRIVDGIKAYIAIYKTIGGFVINRIIDGVKAVAGFASDVGGWIKNRIVEGVQAFAGAIRSVGGWIVNRVADGVKAVAGFVAEVGGWIKNRVTDGIRAFAGAFGEVGGWIVNRVVNGFKAISGVAAEIGGWIRTRVEGAWDAVKGAASDLGEKIGRGIANALKNAVDSVVGAIRSTLNSVIRTVNKVISGFNKLPGPNIGKIAELYTGARNFQGGLALVGERGPELVNLPRGSDVYNARETRGMLAPPHPATGGGVTINHYGDMIVQDPEDRDVIAGRLAWLTEQAA